MTSLAVLSTTLYYVFLPLITILNWIIFTLSPILHLGHYAATAGLFPLRIIAKFETLYIYLGVAAAIGLLTGCALHWSSTALISLFSLDSASHENSIVLESEQGSDVPVPMHRYSRNNTTPRLLQKTAKHSRKEQGLLEQIIIEEEDDASEVGF